ncbi:MAG: ATP-binding protein [Clostridia bacterium]|nr:ATP-binding protein [Clostridia bacterium]
MTLNEALQMKTEKRMAAMDEADKKRRELHSFLPRIKQIDAVISDIPFRALAGESAESLKAEAESLNAERARLLAAAGYEADFDEPEFECTLCNDGGYCGMKLCSCVKKLMATKNYAKSTLAGGLLDKRFENFSLSYYAEENGEKEKMKKIAEGCKKYAESFPENKGCGLLFMGGTGLGKTHLSAAIANTVSERGFSVVYESAQQIYDTLDAVRFNRMELSEKKKYESCALLLIDDLGAECITQYSVSALTSLIDLRIVNGKKTVINTNLTLQSLKKTYGERLYSRLLGEFTVLQFVGKDIRMQKIKEN